MAKEGSAADGARRVCGMGRPEQHRNIRRLNLARVRGEAALRGEPTEFLARRSTAPECKDNIT